MCIAVFSSRTNTFLLFSQLKNYGVDCSIVNMPAQLGSSCTVCIEFKRCYLNKVLHIIKRHNNHCLVNIYAIEIINNCRRYKVIV